MKKMKFQTKINIIKFQPMIIIKEIKYLVKKIKIKVSLKINLKIDFKSSVFKKFLII